MTSGLSKDADTVRIGDKILIYFDPKRRWIVKVEKDRVFSSDRGAIALNNAVGLKYGSKIVSSTGFTAYIMRPLLIDFLEKGMKRVTQIIYPKDQGFITLLLGIASGSKVLEIGVGTGSTTAVLANIVRPTGHVYGYEIRREFLDVAKKNLESLGLIEYVTLKLKDAREGIDEQDIDAAVVDIGDPWSVLESLWQALRPSAPAAFFIPSMNQIEKLYNALLTHRGFADIRCFELLLREIKMSRESIRPSSLMIGHTGYIVFARKVSKE